MAAFLDYEKLADIALGSIQNTLINESLAVSGLAEQYKFDADSKAELASSINLLYQTVRKGGKIVCCGVGKSFKIATKTVATLKSLSIPSDQLHPTEALHGDLGLLSEKDCIIFFTASGNTPELIQLLPHISPSIPIVLLTCSKKSKLSQSHQVKSLLIAELPDHLKESKLHGIPAPTVSATLSLILADAVVLALAEMVERDQAKRQKMFSMKHPGGSIGSDLSHLNDNYTRINQSRSMLMEKGVHDSYASLLSLNQVKSVMDGGMSTNSLESSPVILDSEDFYPAAVNTKLSLAIRQLSNDQCLRAKFEEIKLWTEMDFLRNIALYTHLVYQREDLFYALDAVAAREAYRMIRNKNSQWRGMGDLIKEFQRVDVDTSLY